MSVKKLGHQHHALQKKIKDEIATPQVLAHYDVIVETKICANASSYGLPVIESRRAVENQALLPQVL